MEALPFFQKIAVFCGSDTVHSSERNPGFTVCWIGGTKVMCVTPGYRGSWQAESLSEPLSEPLSMPHFCICVPTGLG